MELEQERSATRSLEGKLAISELDFMKATAQIIDLRGMIATDDSDEDDDDEYRSPSPRKAMSPQRGKATSRSNRSGGTRNRLDRRGEAPTSSSGNRVGSTQSRGSSPFYPAEMSCLKALCGDVRIPSGHNSGVSSPSKRVHEAAPRTFSTLTESHVSSDAAGANDMKIAIAAFEQNFDGLRFRLQQGLKVHVWEQRAGKNVHFSDCLISLDRSADNLLFSGPSNLRRGAFSLFLLKSEVEIEPIRLVPRINLSYLLYLFNHWGSPC